MQYVIMALALVSVPTPEHRLENLTSFRPFFAGEKQLIYEYCLSDLPVVYSIYPGPSRLPEVTITNCVPEQGSQAIKIICAGENVCVIRESSITSEDMTGFIKRWSKQLK